MPIPDFLIIFISYDTLIVDFGKVFQISDIYYSIDGFGIGIAEKAIL
jgi:hypothetical protein